VRAIGPGVITGASDADPTTVTTIAVIGTGTIYELAWLTLLLYPLITVVQSIAARVGVAVADLDDEQAVRALEGYCAVGVGEVGGEHRRCPGMQKRPPGRAGAPLRCRWDLQGLEGPADGGCANLMAELEELAVDPLVPQRWFSVASRSMSAAISALTGGRPVRRG
jgi:hypothetical protein